MTHARVDDGLDRDPPPRLTENLGVNPSKVLDREIVVSLHGDALSAAPRKRTPRHSVILVVCDDHLVDPDLLVHPITCGEEVDVTIAFAGQPDNLDLLKRTARNARFLLAPADMTLEDLRELAMEQTPGDIVTLLDAAHLRPLPVRELFAIS